MVQPKSTWYPAFLIRLTTSTATLLLAIALQASLAAGVLAQETSSDASIEELMSMLQTIDPYRPMGDVQGVVKVFGSTSMDALAHGWVHGFTEFHPAAKIEISAAGSNDAMKRLLENPSGVAMLSRPIRDEELIELKKQGLQEPTAFVVAREALGVFVNAANPVQTISGEQLRAVFTAEKVPAALSWSLLGASGEWAAREINVVSRTEKSGTQMFLQDFVFHDTQLRAGKVAFDSNAQVVEAVMKDPLAIAICGLHCGRNTAKALQLTAGGNAVPSDDHAILTGQYPLTRPMSIIIDLGQSSAEAIASQELVRYALCHAGQTQAILAGFYPVDLPLLRAGMQKLNLR